MGKSRYPHCRHYHHTYSFRNSYPSRWRSSLEILLLSLLRRPGNSLQSSGDICESQPAPIDWAGRGFRVSGQILEYRCRGSTACRGLDGHGAWRFSGRYPRDTGSAGGYAWRIPCRGYLGGDSCHFKDKTQSGRCGVHASSQLCDDPHHGGTPFWPSSAARLQLAQIIGDYRGCPVSDPTNQVTFSPGNPHRLIGRFGHMVYQ